MEKIVERKPLQSLIELFHECFPGWKVKSWVCMDLNTILVRLESGVSYEFGTNESGDIYLNRLDSQKTQAV